MRLSIIVLSCFIHLGIFIGNQSYAMINGEAAQREEGAAAAEEIVFPEKDTGNIGEIRYSILNAQQFQRIYGREWILMDGRDIRGEELHTSGLWTETHIPDVRGTFLRCKNNGRNDGKQNTGGDLAVGTYQEDQIKSHNHSISLHGSIFFSRFNPWCEHKDGFAAGGCFGGKHAHDTGVTRDGLPDTNLTGGLETNPRCITVNAFIKVRRTLNDQKTNVIMKAIENLPEQIAKNPGLATIIRQLVQQEVHRAIPIAQGQGRTAPVIGGNP